MVKILVTWEIKFIALISILIKSLHYCGLVKVKEIGCTYRTQRRDDFVKISVEEPETKTLLDRHRLRRKSNIKIDLNKVFF